MNVLMACLFSTVRGDEFFEWWACLTNLLVINSFHDELVYQSLCAMLCTWFTRKQSTVQ
jgi:hypothetical protein